MSAHLPSLKTSGPVTQLVVDGEPFLVLGGELGNSTASDLDTLDEALGRCAAMNLNAVLLPVYWDRIEPTEGTFDFTLVRGAIDLARKHDLRLIYLWFGTWKNSMSCYAPSWVKRDTRRFTRAERGSGELLEIVSPACEAAVVADAKAFAALLKWIKSYDQAQRTVVMVQVENEIGMIPEPRDHSEASERAYSEPVPDKFLQMAARGELGPEVQALWESSGKRPAGAWGEVFGDSPEADEVFSAWQFSRYAERVAAAGKEQYALPMLANAALIRPGYRPNQYPSAGPLPHLMGIWRLGAPSLDMICPDIYFPNFMEWSRSYTRNLNPLFIPEMAPSMRASGNVVWAIGELRAMGCAPFSIETMNAEKNRLLASCYARLSGMSGVILKAQREGAVIGLSPRVGFDWSIDEAPIRGELGGVVFEARFDRAGVGDSGVTTLPTLGAGRWDAPPGTPLGAALIVQLAQEEFAILGMDVTVTFSSSDGRGRVGIDSAREGIYQNGSEWVGGNWLNGDQTHQGRHVRLEGGRWTIQRVKTYRY